MGVLRLLLVKDASKRVIVLLNIRLSSHLEFFLSAMSYVSVTVMARLRNIEVTIKLLINSKASHRINSQRGGGEILFSSCASHNGLATETTWSANLKPYLPDLWPVAYSEGCRTFFTFFSTRSDKFVGVGWKVSIMMWPLHVTISNASVIVLSNMLAPTEVCFQAHLWSRAFSDKLYFLSNGSFINLSLKNKLSNNS